MALMIGYILMTANAIYWIIRAMKAERKVMDLTYMSRLLIEQAGKVLELSDEILNEPNIVEHEEDC